MSAGLPAEVLPSGPAFTVVLICHVSAVLIGLLATTVSAVQGCRLLTARDEALPASVRAYFSPGINWVARVLYLVPVFGVALVVMSKGVYPIGASWVIAGIGLWLAAIGVAEGVLWPAEQRVARALSHVHEPDATSWAIASGARRASKAVCAGGSTVVALMIGAMVVMFAKP